MKRRDPSKFLNAAAVVMSGALLALVFAPGVLISQEAEHPLDEVYRDAIDARPASDAGPAVLRRLSLQTRGVIPTVEEQQQYAALPPARARREFAARYLRDPDFAHYWGVVFGDMLREQTDMTGAKEGAYFDFLAQSLHGNKPYDQFVRELLTAEGSAAKNPAIHFYLRDGADPLQVAEYVSRIFYGRNLACARCHNHPFDPEITQRDYYAFAAFFSQVWVKQRYEFDRVPRERQEHFPTEAKKAYEEEYREWRRNVWDKLNEAQQKAYREKHKLEYASIEYEPDLQLRFPVTDDQPGGDLVDPRFPDGSRALVRDGEDRREALVRWLTARENERFRRVIINRVWHRMTGWAFFEPFDDWGPETEVRHAEILDHLDAYFLKNGHRIKDLIYYIATSEAYARRAPQPGDQDAENPYVYFQPRRMDAPQLMNSLIRGTQVQSVRHINERANVSADPTPAPGVAPDLRGQGPLLSVKDRRSQRDFQNACQVRRPVSENTFLAIFGEGQRNDVDDFSRQPSIDQVLTLLNGRLTEQVLREYGKDGSWIKQDYQQHQSMQASAANVYRSLLGRAPSAEERERLQGMLDSPYMGRREEGFDQGLVQDLAWAIIVSQEFIHIY